MVGTPLERRDCVPRPVFVDEWPTEDSEILRGCAGTGG